MPISFDNVLILNLDSTNPKSATSIEYVENLNKANNLYFYQKNIGVGIPIPTEAFDISGVIQSNFVKTNGITVWNPINTSGQDAFVNIRVAGKESGNPYISLNIEAEQDAQWSLGIDNSDNNFNIKNKQNFVGSSLFNISKSGFIGINGVSNPTAEITLPSTNKNKKILLYDINLNNQHQFTGFGSSSTELRYQLYSSSVDHVFYSAVNDTSSKELLRIKGNGRVGIGTSDPLGKTSIFVDQDIWGLNLVSTLSTGKGSGILLTNNSNGGRSFAIYSKGNQKLSFTDIASTNTEFLTLDQNGSLELGNNNKSHISVKGLSGYIGLGTNNPTSKLHILNSGNENVVIENSGTTILSDANLSIVQSGGTGSNISSLKLINNNQQVGINLTKQGNLSLSQQKINGNNIVDMSQNKLTIRSDGDIEVNQNMNVLGKVKENGFDLLPVGTILPYAGESAPGGYLMCNGAEYDISLYPRLYQVIKDLYGKLSNPNLFKVPDLRCRFPVGVGSSVLGRGNINSLGQDNATSKNIGTSGGAEKVKLINTEMPTHRHTGDTNQAGAHTHTLKYYNDDFNEMGGNWDTVSFANDSNSFRGEARTTSAGQHIHSFTTSDEGGGQPHENLPPYLAINYIIKF
jgi:microcystin-dependent protein